MQGRDWKPCQRGEREDVSNCQSEYNRILLRIKCVFTGSLVCFLNRPLETYTNGRWESLRMQVESGQAGGAQVSPFFGWEWEKQNEVGRFGLRFL